MGLFFKTYAFLFGRRFLLKSNQIINQLSLRSIGILNSQNSYLSGEKAWLQKQIGEKDSILILDVGANVGNYSKEILKINSKAIIYAFEPHPETYELLKKNIVVNNCLTFNFGVGDRREELMLYDYESESGSEHASLYKAVIEDLRNKPSISNKVQIIKLDDFLAEQKIEYVDLLKIDTEGNEYKVLLGAQDYLLNNRIAAIQFEFNEMNVISRTFFKDFWDLLPNYNFFRLLPGGGLLHIKEYSPVNCEIFAFQNIVATLKDSKKKF